MTADLAVAFRTAEGQEFLVVPTADDVVTRHRPEGSKDWLKTKVKGTTTHSITVGPVTVPVTEKDEAAFAQGGWSTTLGQKLVRALRAAEEHAPLDISHDEVRDHVDSQSDLVLAWRDNQGGAKKESAKPSLTAQGYVHREVVPGVTDFDMLDYAREHAENVLLSGPSGSGKSTLPVEYARERGLDSYCVAGNVALEPSQLFGKFVPEADGGFAWCVAGDTQITWANSRPGKPGTIKEVHDLLHGRVDTSDGLCVACGVNPRPKGRWANSPVGDRCEKCRKFLNKVRQRGNLMTLGRRGDRLFPEHIADVVYQGVRETIQVTTVSGRSITATPDHRHLTARGWVTVEDLTLGDALATLGGHEAWSNPRNYLGVHVPKRERKEAAGGFCEWCGEEAKLDLAHLSGDTTDNSPENIAALCRSCHLKHDYATGQRSGKNYTRGDLIAYEKIVSIEPTGAQPVYDVVMETEDHSWVANGFVTHNCEGPVTRLVRDGGVLVLDEVNILSPKIATVLYPLLDFRREITLLDNDGEVIKAHKDLLVVATCNPGYQGTMPMSEALLDRFAHRHDWGYDAHAEEELVSSESLLGMARGIRADGDVRSPFSTRLLVAFEKFALSPLGWDYAVANLLGRFSDSEDRESVRALLDVRSDKIQTELGLKPLPDLVEAAKAPGRPSSSEEWRKLLSMWA